MNKIQHIADIAGKFKELKRTGWVQRHIPNPESIADHTFGVSLLTFLLCPKDLNREKCLELAIVHDLQETLTGDVVTTYSNDEEKDHQISLEQKAIKVIAQQLESPEIVNLFNELIENTTPEAQFVISLDKLEAVLQAKYYVETNQAPPLLFEEFHQNAIQTLKVKNKSIQKIIKDLTINT